MLMIVSWIGFHWMLANLQLKSYSNSKSPGPLYEAFLLDESNPTRAFEALEIAQLLDARTRKLALKCMYHYHQPICKLVHKAHTEWVTIRWRKSSCTKYIQNKMYKYIYNFKSRARHMATMGGKTIIIILTVNT